MRIRMIAVALMVVALQLGVVASAQATTCSYRASDNSVRASVSDFLSVVVTRNGDMIELLIDNTYVPCGSATITNTNKVVVKGTGGSSDTYFANFVGVSEELGRLGPGATAEGSGVSEIEIVFKVTPANSVFPPGDPLPLYFQYVGTSGADTMTMDASGVDLNDDGDVDVTSSYSFQGAWLFGVGGGDVIDASSFAFPTRVEGGKGKDRLTGGTAADELTGDGGADRLTGGPGNDTITANDGQADQIDGGDDEDTAYVDAALDAVINVEHVYT